MPAFLLRSPALLLIAALAACSGGTTAHTGAADDAAPPPASTATPAAGSDMAGESAAPAILLLSPGDPQSIITAHTSAADLVRRFGADQVRSGPVGLGEGESVPGSILFPDDSLRRATIVWMDSTRSAPARVEVSGSATRWQVPPGISIGVSLDSLEALNGEPFDIYGFGWDYEGTVASWNGGELAGLLSDSARVLVRLSPTAQDSVPDEEAATVSGERSFPSSNDVIQRLRPRVYDILALFGGR